MTETLRRRARAALRRTFPAFGGDGILTHSKITSVRTPGFCIGFRHDMDLISDGDALDRFLEVDAPLGVASTCFFRLEDIARYRARARQLIETGIEVQLHSEARPRVVLSLPKIPAEGWLVYRYATNLARQKRALESLLGCQIAGHCPHAVNNYLYFNTYMNWSIIERATAMAGFRYLSDWRAPSRTSENESFPAPLPPYRHVVAGGATCLVLPTAWDDKYLFSSFEDIHIRRTLTNNTVGHSEEEAFSNLLSQLRWCRRQDVPFILNLHPVHMLNPELPALSLKARLVSWARENDIQVRTLAQISDSLCAPVPAEDGVSMSSEIGSARN